MIEKLTNYLESTSFYKEYMVNWQPPLNDPSFVVTLVLFMLVIVLIPEIFDLIRFILRLKKKSGELQGLASANPIDGASGSHPGIHRRTLLIKKASKIEEQTEKITADPILDPECGKNSENRFRVDPEKNDTESEPPTRNTKDPQVEMSIGAISTENLSQETAPAIDGEEDDRSITEEQTEADEEDDADKGAIEKLLAMAEKKPEDPEEPDSADDFTKLLQEIQAQKDINQQNEEREREKEALFRKNAEDSSAALEEMFSAVS